MYGAGRICYHCSDVMMLNPLRPPDFGDSLLKSSRVPGSDSLYVIVRQGRQLDIEVSLVGRFHIDYPHIPSNNSRLEEFIGLHKPCGSLSEVQTPSSLPNVDSGGLLKRQWWYGDATYRFLNRLRLSKFLLQCRLRIRAGHCQVSTWA